MNRVEETTTHENIFIKEGRPDWIADKMNNRNEFLKKKFASDKAYYDGKLESMVMSTLSVIDRDTTPDQLQNILKVADKEWKGICSRARQTNKHISLHTQALLQMVIYNLQKRNVLSKVPDGEAIEIINEESGEAKVISLDEPFSMKDFDKKIVKVKSEDLQNENDMLSAANDVDMSEIKLSGKQPDLDLSEL
jgi:hypothetical protein